jgi:hypothetical protein
MKSKSEKLSRIESAKINTHFWGQLNNCLTSYGTAFPQNGVTVDSPIAKETKPSGDGLSDILCPIAFIRYLSESMYF